MVYQTRPEEGKLVSDISLKNDTLNTVGQILNIQHFCTNDGPGIRTTVFLKGCPLSCVWCHNPETHDRHCDVLFRAEKCSACGACLAACPTGAHSISEDGVHSLDRALCVRCGKCTTACLFGALEYAGEEMSVGEVMAALLSDRIFYETSGGGITLSGGEPTAQADFTEALLSACRDAGLHTALETSGACSEETLLRLLPHTDLFLLDWKLTDDALHKKYTGVSNRSVLRTLDVLEAHGKRVILRCPLIPDVNTCDTHYDGIGKLTHTYSCIESVELEPYHPLGVGKTEALGRIPAYQNREFMDRERAAHAKSCVEKRSRVPVFLSTT
ncbi:MAG: glycyl-radical enzyme activating protein [Ruminococcaceae bacterium]|nr:glycyl-radical enzyme activating protein [Oscillospiraceae bacterium]